ncbi:DUF4097 family beta strand repeat-containing protein [Actinoplanes sp. DH11]|uniref:DUF4097 family beta strand repeat-containing protein n=1 Tax=Actinoplanes sp. DH11 TaxID=2857011 RepID=UPI001E5DD544|nr:DUF4097 family beta strand repeat-containing protein [Actinoplanes sp. DH11]
MSRKVALVLAAASMIALAGCDGVVGARMTFEDTEKAKITDIVLRGGGGDVLINTADTTETSIRRVIRGSTDPGPSYSLSGSTLDISTDCGRNCHVSYEITAPAGVAVKGDVRSGDMGLTGVGAVDLKMTSGDILVERATGPVAIEATSGDMSVTGAPSLTVELTSGDIRADDIAGPIEARATSGDMSLVLDVPASVTASVQSGDLNLTVPDGAYRVKTEAGGGDVMVENLANDAKATHVLDLRTRSGDLFVTTG